MTRRVLIVGGTGVFGSRLARHLATFKDIALTVTSRSATSAQALAHTLDAQGETARVTGIALDRTRDPSAQLGTLKPWAVIDCSGPFQTASYDLARAAIRQGAHIVDLADARAYLLGYRNALDTLARQHGVSALAGASSTPALSGAVIAALTKGWREIRDVDIAISPGGKSDVGSAVVAAILSYAGKEIPVWSDGRLARTHGWIGARKIAMPGLGIRRVAPVETADAELSGPRFAITGRLSFRAGLESRIEQYGLEALAHLRRRFGIATLDRLVPALLAARKLTRLVTSDLGGMNVEIAGKDAQGKETSARWSLLAENNHGPYVPVMAAAAAIRALLAGRIAPGAATSDRVLPLAAIEAEMKPYAIRTSMERTFHDHIRHSEAAAVPFG